MDCIMPTPACAGLFAWAFDPRRRRARVQTKDGHKRCSQEPAGIRQSDGIRVKGGRRLEMQLAFYSTGGCSSPLCRSIVEAERAIGIDVTIERIRQRALWHSTVRCTKDGFRSALLTYQSGLDPRSDMATVLAGNGLQTVSTGRATAIPLSIVFCSARVPYTIAPRGSAYIGSSSGS